MKEIRKLVAHSTSSIPLSDPIIEFENYIENVMESTEIKNNEMPTPKKVKTRSQRSGKCFQDNMDLTKVDRDHFHVSNCANCKHPFLLPIGISALEINYHNDGVKKYRDKLSEWNQLIVSRIGPKPKAGMPISQKLVCLCT